MTTVYYPDGWVGEESWVGVFLYSGQEILDRGLDSTPGQTYEYSTGIAHLMSAVITKRISLKQAPDNIKVLQADRKEGKITVVI